MSLYISNRLVRLLLKDALTLWIDPSKIHFHFSTSRPANKKDKKQFSKPQTINAFVKLARRQKFRVTNAFESFVVDPSNYPDLEELEQHKNYIRIKNFIKQRDDYKKSEWYSDLVFDLNEHGFAKHKKIMMMSKSDIENFMESYVLSLLDSLERDGFDLRKGGGIGRAMIGEDGAIHKTSSGRHRLFAARELEISPIPVRIAGVHEGWYRKHVGGGFTAQKLRLALSEVQSKHS